MIQQAHSHFLVSGSDIEFSKGQLAAVSWWLSGGIAAANCIGAYLAKGAASLAASYTNLANPGTFTLSLMTAAPDWTGARGWYGWAAGKALNTGITPVNDQTWSMVIRANQTGANSYRRLASTGASVNADFYLSSAHDGLGAGYANGGSLSVAPAPGAGVITLGVAGNQGYRNGVADGGAIGAPVGNITTPIAIGGRYINIWSIGSVAEADIYAVSIYNTPITAPQEAAVHAAMLLL